MWEISDKDLKVARLLRKHIHTQKKPFSAQLQIYVKLKKRLKSLSKDIEDRGTKWKF